MHDPPQHPLGAPPGTKQSRFRSGFIRITICLNLLAHLLDLYVAWRIGGVSLAAFVMTVFYIPLLNGALALAALLAAPFLKRQDPYFSLRRHLDVAFGVPLGAVLVAILILFLCAGALGVVGH